MDKADSFNDDDHLKKQRTYASVPILFAEKSFNNALYLVQYSISQLQTGTCPLIYKHMPVTTDMN